MNSPSVVIAGAGIAGIATAHHLAIHHGITNVVLVDPRPPLTLTSNKTGANYRDWWPNRPMVQLAQRSIQLMEEMRASGAPFTLTRSGYLYISTRSNLAVAAEYAGLEHTLLDRDAIRRAYPHFSPNLTGAIHALNAGTIDTVGLGRYLLQAAMQRGVRLLEGEVIGIDGDSNMKGVTVRTPVSAQRSLLAGRFVNAAGPFAGKVARLMGLNLPLTNVLQQKITIADPDRIIPADTPFTVSLDDPAGLHIKPDTVDGKPVIRLGWAINQQAEEPQWDPQGSPEFPGTVLRAAARLVPALPAPSLRPGQSAPVPSAGYYTRTPDELPLIGPSGPDGAFIVGGLAGFGGMVACAAAEITAAWIAGAERPAWAQAFEPGRTGSPGAGLLTGAL